MAKKSLGYVELEWTCPNCDSRNPGSRRICANCGTPQPDNLEFTQRAQSEIIKDEAKIEQAKAGPDIHCYYCGTRNPATAETCSQCGSPLNEGTRRSAGKVVGAHRTGPVKPVVCDNCQTENEPNAPMCVSCGTPLKAPKPKAKPKPTPRPTAKKSSSGGRAVFGIFGILMLFIVVGCGIFFFFSFQTSEVTGQVSNINWSRSVAVEGLAPVGYSGWIDQIPGDATVGTCRTQVRDVQDNPAPNSREICGTPYVLDEGSGFGQVVQDCRYEVLEEFCEYTVQEWTVVDTVTQSDNSFNAFWPEPALGFDQRLGERTENYEVIFNTEQGRMTYSVNGFEDFRRYDIGTRWILDVNSFGGVVSARPAN